MRNYYCVVTFHSTYHALNFEKIMKENDLTVKLMPVPRQVSSSCGTAAEIPCHQRDDILLICQENQIEIDEVHRIESPTKSNWFIRLANKST